MEHVLMTIVTPLKKKDANGAVVVENVVADRLQSDKNRPQNHGANLKSITKEFISGESKRGKNISYAVKFVIFTRKFFIQLVIYIFRASSMSSSSMSLPRPNRQFQSF